MIPASPLNLNATQRRLLSMLGKLSPADQDHLLVFAEFLASRKSPSDQNTSVADELSADLAATASEPEIEPRPSDESVIAAIKRLSRSYSMLDKADMLHETSDLMSAHVLKGKPAVEVIDELEVLFVTHYEKWSQSKD